jgi:hypothetical protein
MELFEPELHAIRTHHVNVLIQGTTSFIADLFRAVRSDLDRPECMWPDIPTDGNMWSATVLVPEVGTLTARALDSLADLIEHRWRAMSVPSAAAHDAVAGCVDATSSVSMIVFRR